MTIQERNRAVLATIAAAIREGRHSEHWTTWCDECGKEVPAVWYVVGRRRLCRACAPPDPAKK